MIVRHGDLGLLDGKWHIICSPGLCDPVEWPLPAFGRISLMNSSVALKVTYVDNDLLAVVSEKPISVEEARRLPSDGSCGSRGIEISLNHLLAK